MVFHQKIRRKNKALLKICEMETFIENWIIRILRTNFQWEIKEIEDFHRWATIAIFNWVTNWHIESHSLFCLLNRVWDFIKFYYRNYRNKIWTIKPLWKMTIIFSWALNPILEMWKWKKHSHKMMRRNGVKQIWFKKKIMKILGMNTNTNQTI